MKQAPSAKTAKVVLIRSNPVSNDPRAVAIASALAREHRVLVLAWDREDTYGRYECFDNRLLIKRLKLRSPYGSSRLVLYYPIFWLWVLVNLVVYRPQVIHACDLETLIPSYVFRLFFPVKIVFDSFDRFAMAFVPPRYSFVYRCLNALEDLLASYADALVTVSRERLATFKRRPPKSEIVMNCPEDLHDRIRLETAYDRRVGNQFILVYTGSIAADRGLLLLSRATKNIESARLVLAGRVIDRDLLKTLLRNARVEYIGHVTRYEALKLESSANAIPVLYDPSVPINRVANPNKLFEAMMLSIPVIANVCEEIIAKSGCGLVVEYDQESVEKAIVRLMKSGSLRRKMGARGRVSFVEKYNWSRMREKLLAVYKQLLFDWT